MVGMPELQEHLSGRDSSGRHPHPSPLPPAGEGAKSSTLEHHMWRGCRNCRSNLSGRFFRAPPSPQPSPASGRGGQEQYARAPHMAGMPVLQEHLSGPPLPGATLTPALSRQRERGLRAVRWSTTWRGSRNGRSIYPAAPVPGATLTPALSRQQERGLRAVRKLLRPRQQEWRSKVH